MKKARFNYWKLTAVVAVLAITIIAGVRPSTATKQPPRPAAAVPGTDLANEERAVAKYFDDLVAYQSECAKLGKQAVLEHIHINPVQAKSDDLKSRLPGLQNTIREIVRKLKAANEWDDLDRSIAASITDASQRSFFQQDSFKQVLEESSNSLTSHGNEISTPLDNLRKKLASRTSPYGNGSDLQIVQTAYEAPAPMKFVSLRCTIGRMRIGLIHKLGGRATPETWGEVIKACDPGGSPAS